MFKSLFCLLGLSLTLILMQDFISIHLSSYPNLKFIHFSNNNISLYSTLESNLFFMKVKNLSYLFSDVSLKLSDRVILFKRN